LAGANLELLNERNVQLIINHAQFNTHAYSMILLEVIEELFHYIELLFESITSHLQKKPFALCFYLSFHFLAIGLFLWLPHAGSLIEN
jgi:hypothetical protein